MDKKTHYKTDENGIFYKEETIRTTPQDGLVQEQDIRPGSLSRETRGKYHAGHRTTKRRSTNDPRFTRGISAAFCGIFSLIGIILLPLRLWIFAAAFLGSAAFLYIKGNRDIDAIAEKQKQQGKDVTIDSREELHTVVSDATGTMKTDFQQVGQETFTKANTRHFAKTTLPIYCVLTLVLSVLLGTVAHPVLGIGVFLLLAAGGALYYVFVLFLLPKLFSK